MARPRSARKSARAAETAPVGRPGDEAALASRLPALRTVLEQQRHFRREQLALIAAGGTRVSSSDADPMDCRNKEATSALREVDALVVAGARRALADIELALVRMRTGRYGLCRSCGSRIPVVVLEAIPKTTLCLACQHRSERGNDQQVAARSRNRVRRRGEVASGRRR